MTQDAPTAREAAERNAKAVMAGDLTQVMADITPEAMAKLMQLGSQAQASGAPNPAAMPSIQSYTIEDVGDDDEGSTFRVTFVSAAGKATLETRWQQVMGHWKVVDVALVSAELNEMPGHE
jgi:hypothetical protein